MLTNGKLLVIDETDIIKQSQTKPAHEIRYDDLRIKSKNAVITAEIVVANLPDGVILMKNRWSHPGVVITLEDYKKFNDLKNENNKSDNTPKEKSFLGRIFSGNIWPFSRS